MIEYSNECVGCPPEMGCLGDSCPNRNVPHYVCDKCGIEYEPTELYDVYGEHLCEDCMKLQFPKLKED